MFKALLFAVPFLVQGVNSTPPSVQVSGRVTADNATGTRVIRVAMSSAAGAEPLTAICGFRWLVRILESVTRNL